MKKDKRGLESSTLIGIFIAIVGFLIVLFVYYQINWTDEVNDSVCHESVILRASIPDFAGAKEIIPLKCYTKKFCISSNKKGDCNEFTNADSVNSVKVSSTTQIEKAISDEIVSCWGMMGEGKVSLFSQGYAKYGVGGVYPTCVICSRIAFDKESLEENEIDLEDVNVLEYMLTHKMSGKEISYYRYLAGNVPVEVDLITKNSVLIPEVSEEEVDGEKQIVVGENVEKNLEKEEFVEDNFEEIAIVFMQISAPTQGGSIGSVGKAIAGAGLASFFLAPVKTSSLMLRGTWTAVTNPLATFIVFTLGVGGQQLNVAYNRAVTAGYCGSVSTGGEARDGCSVIKTVKYNEEELSKFCSVIESIA